MWRSKKFIITALVAAAVLAGSLGGIALAHTENDPDSSHSSLLERITAILVDDGVNITSEQLKDAFTQATGELRDEALENRFQALVEAGKLTQEEADQLKEWLESKPDTSFRSGFRGHGRFPGMGGFGMHRMGGFGAHAMPTE